MKNILISCCVIALSLTVVGAIYQYVSEKGDRSSIPGNLLVLGDKTIHVFCMGAGEPTVFLENGTWGSYPDWLDVMMGVQHKTRICSYDRLGIGWSSGNDTPINAKDITRTFKAMLKGQDVTQPIILVGFSAGGIYTRKYVESYPADVFALVLVDSAHEQQVVRNAYRPNDTQLVQLCSAIAWTGVIRALGLMDADVPSSFDANRALAQRNIYYRTSFCSGLLEQAEGFPMEFTGLPPNNLGSIPLVVITSEKTLRQQGFGHRFSDEFLDSHEREWPILQKELASISTNSDFVIARNSGHSIPIEQPEIIIDAILKLVREARSDNQRSHSD